MGSKDVTLAYDNNYDDTKGNKGTRDDFGSFSLKSYNG